MARRFFAPEAPSMSPASKDSSIADIARTARRGEAGGGSAIMLVIVAAARLTLHEAPHRAWEN